MLNSTCFLLRKHHFIIILSSIRPIENCYGHYKTEFFYCFIYLLNFLFHLVGILNFFFFNPVKNITNKQKKKLRVIAMTMFNNFSHTSERNDVISRIPIFFNNYSDLTSALLHIIDYNLTLWNVEFGMNKGQGQLSLPSQHPFYSK
jgi:hypothetical protein